MSSFFLSTESADPAYLNVRDHPRGVHHKPFVESLWQEYEPFADRHFKTDAPKHFHQRFWEMYLCVALLRQGLRPVKTGDDGPEFYCEINGKRIWFEAVAPNPGTGPDRVVEPVMGEVSQVPTEKIILRFTQALIEKRKKYIEARDKGLIESQDGYVLALNSRGIPHAPFGDVLPHYLYACLPIGPLSATFDRESRKVLDVSHTHRGSVSKKNESIVSTDNLLSDDFRFLSSIIHSAADCANNNALNLCEDFSMLHNPYAVHGFQRDTFSWVEQYFIQEGEDGFRLQNVPGS